MKGLLAVIIFTLLTAFCWGIYGPVLHHGQHDMGGMLDGKHVNSMWRPFMCVGIAYFLIAVLVPGLWLKARGEVGKWTATGIIWSLAGGAAGAVGALGIIMAFKFGGRPIYVMPLVFGCAPVVNTFVTMFMTKTTKQAGPIFFAGLILVVAGAVGVLLTKPSPPAPVAKTATAAEPAKSTEATKPEQSTLKKVESDVLTGILIAASIALTAISWGSYGPVLHKGQAAMQGSRLRPLICVGMAYFLIAVIVPGLVMTVVTEPGQFNFGGSMWSLAGGAAGAIGALGIILAFNSGGKPIFVMPLVFGGAPVINTFTTVFENKQFDQIGPLFYAALLVVMAGAVTVLIFAPKGKPHAPAKKALDPAVAAK